MILHNPFTISPRLLPALQIGDGTISLETTGKTGEYGKPRWRWYIDIPAGEFTDDDFCGWGDAQQMFAALLDFLRAAAESYAYKLRTGHSGDNADLFPEPVVAWADQHSDELSLLAVEIEETPNLIEEQKE